MCSSSPLVQVAGHTRVVMSSDPLSDTYARPTLPNLTSSLPHSIPACTSPPSTPPVRALIGTKQFYSSSPNLSYPIPSYCAGHMYINVNKPSYLTTPLPSPTPSTSHRSQSSLQIATPIPRIAKATLCIPPPKQTHLQSPIPRHPHT